MQYLPYFAIGAGILLIMLPQFFVYLIALALIIFGVDALFPDLKHQAARYFRGLGR